MLWSYNLSYKAFRIWTQVGPRNHVLSRGRGYLPRRKWQFLGSVFQPILKYMECLTWTKVICELAAAAAFLSQHCSNAATLFIGHQLVDIFTLFCVQSPLQYTYTVLERCRCLTRWLTVWSSASSHSIWPLTIRSTRATCPYCSIEWLFCHWQCTCGLTPASVPSAAMNVANDSRRGRTWPCTGANTRVNSHISAHCVERSLSGSTRWSATCSCTTNSRIRRLASHCLTVKIPFHRQNFRLQHCRGWVSWAVPFIVWV